MMFDRIVTHEQARQAFNRMHDALYNSKPTPPLSVPVQPDDVDVILGDYIQQRKEAESQLADARATGAREAYLLFFKPYYTTPDSDGSCAICGHFVKGKESILLPKWHHDTCSIVRPLASSPALSSETKGNENG